MWSDMASKNKKLAEYIAYMCVSSYLETPILLPVKSPARHMEVYVTLRNIPHLTIYRASIKPCLPVAFHHPPQ